MESPVVISLCALFGLFATLVALSNADAEKLKTLTKFLRLTARRK